MQTPAATSSLPIGFQIAAFVLSVVLASLRVFEFTNRSRLSIHLTKDLFFRLIDAGEALFCHSVLLANNGPVLVRDVRLLLRRVSKDREERAEKSFPLEVRHFGEVVPGETLFADHKFTGSSPLLYLGPNTPYRSVYLCLQKEYSEEQKKACDEFVAEMRNFKAANPNPAQEDTDRLLKEINSLVEKHYRTMSNLIQLESGDYELDLKVRYESIGRHLWKCRHETSSKISFTIEHTQIESWKAALLSLLQVSARQILADTHEELQYPVLVPAQVAESGGQK